HVDQERGRGQAQVHHRHQALASRDRAGVLAPLGEQGQRLRDGAGPLVGHRGEYVRHQRASLRPTLRPSRKATISATRPAAAPASCFLGSSELSSRLIGSASATGAAGAGALPGAGAGRSICAARLSANWRISLELTSLIGPCPSWATRPVRPRSVDRFTCVPSGTSVRLALILAFTVPPPRRSRPPTSMVATLFASSLTTNLASPV